MSTAERKEREKLRRRNEIVDAAEKLLFSKGFEKVTMDDIAKETELARGTLYLYFKNRDDIIAAIGVRGIKILNRLYRESVGKGKTGIEKIRHALYASYEYGSKYPGYYSTLNYMVANGFEKKDFPDKAELISIHGDNNRMILSAFDEGIRDGSLKSDLDPMKAGIFLTAAIDSVISTARSTGMQEEFVNYSIGLMLRSIENAKG